MNPIDMVLHCPACGLQHIDAPDPTGFSYHGLLKPWGNPPHRSHLCHGCGHIWRPADVPTNGVAAINTRGKNDSPLSAQPAEPVACSLGCVDECKARQHGCASECPALPSRPPFATPQPPHQEPT